MEDFGKEYNREKTLFKSYYCAGCKQVKPCHILNKEYCCACAYEREKEQAQEYSNYEKVLTSRQKEKQENFQQLQLLKNYQFCRNCASKEIDAYSFYTENKLTCGTCLVKKAGGASIPISFTEQSKWYKKYGAINLGEMLDKFAGLPINKNCADKWLKDSQHLNNCQCLEQEVQKLHDFFTNSLRESKKKLEKCSCEKSKKVRINSDYSTNCQGCEREISVASKKRVIKNRNDPRFGGLAIEEKVLCLACLGKLVEKMPINKKYTFGKYIHRGYI